MSRLDLVVGPNGAGKSTFVRFVLAPQLPGVPFVNADVLAEQRWPGDAMRHAYEASEMAAQAREQLLAARRPFIAATVASHPSKVDLVARAKQLGYTVHVHVLMVPQEQAILRVARRVDAGGHDVPDDKIRDRYARLWELVAAMVELADTVEMYDNSGHGPRTIDLFVSGQLVGAARWPTWAPAALSARWL